ncbi:hypothetical protein ACJ41O_014504 [Fusarium nematophilum]
MDRCKALFHRFLIVLLGTALLSQLALLPALANGLSINPVAEGASADAIPGSLLERDSALTRADRFKRHFYDAGSHKLFSRALNPRYVTEGARFICALNNRDYPDPSPWTNVASIQGHSEGWDSQFLGTNDEVLNTLQPWLAANGLSSAAGSYRTVQTRNDRNKPGTSANIFGLDEGTIIVEDVLNPKAAPALRWRAFEQFMEPLGGVDMAEIYDVETPPRDASGWEIPPLTQWSDIAYLQLVHASGGAQGQIQGVKRIIQFHAHIRDALAIASSSLAAVNIDNGGAAVEFLPDTEACQALFKTPNGNGGYFLFAQHPTQMGSKTLEKISVFSSSRNQADATPINDEDTSVWYYMVAHFKEAPTQEDL